MAGKGVGSLVRAVNKRLGSMADDVGDDIIESFIKKNDMFGSKADDITDALLDNLTTPSSNNKVNIKRPTNLKPVYKSQPSTTQGIIDAVDKDIAAANPIVNPTPTINAGGPRVKQAFESTPPPTSNPNIGGRTIPSVQYNDPLQSVIEQTSSFYDGSSTIPASGGASAKPQGAIPTSNGPTIASAKNHEKNLKKRAEELKGAAAKGRKQNEMNRKWNKGVQTTVGVGVTGALVLNMFDNKGQQSNSQLYNQGY